MKQQENTILDELYNNHKIYVDEANRRSHPNIVSGMKEVALHILQGVIESKYFINTVKSAKVVGQVMGELHPHGDAAIYGAVTNMLNTHDIRYPYLEGQGSFGSADGDPAAAMRYTELKVSKIFRTMLNYTIYTNTDVSQPKLNYDGTLDEWKFLILPYSPILMNGTTGIGVGNATTIPSMNMYDIMKLYKLCIMYIKEVIKANKGMTLYDLLMDPKYLHILGGFNYEYMVKKSKTNLIVPDFPIPIKIDIEAATFAMVRGRGSFKYRSNYRLIKDKSGHGIKTIEIVGIMFQNSGLAVKEKLNKYILDMGEIYDIQEFSDSKSMLNTDKVIYTIEFNTAKNYKVANKIANNIINSISGLSGNYNVNYKVISDDGSTIIDTNPFYVCITSLIRFIFSHKSDKISLYNKKMKEFYLKSVIYNSISRHSIGVDRDNSVLHSVVEIVSKSETVDDDLYEELDLEYCDHKHVEDNNFPTSETVINYLKLMPLSKLRLLASDQFAEDLTALNEETMGIKVLLEKELELINYVSSIYDELEASLHKFNKSSLAELNDSIGHKAVYRKIYSSLGLSIIGLLDRRSTPLLPNDEIDGDVIDEEKKYTLFISTDNRTLLYEGHINITDIASKLGKSNIKVPFICKFTIHAHAGADVLLFTQNRAFRLKLNSDFINSNLRLLNLRISNKDMLPLYSNHVNITRTSNIITNQVINEYPARILLIRSDGYGYIMELNKKKIKNNGIPIFSNPSLNLNSIITINKDDDRILVHTASNKYAVINLSDLPSKEDGTLIGTRIIGGKNNTIMCILPFGRKHLPFMYSGIKFDGNLVRKLTSKKLNISPKRI